MASYHCSTGKLCTVAVMRCNCGTRRIQETLHSKVGITAQHGFAVHNSSILRCDARTITVA